MKTWRAYNVAKSVVVASDVEIAETGWARLKGLLGRSAQEFPPGRGLWIAPCQGVHTIGMSFPIDVAYLDSGGRIIKIYNQLVPFRVAGMSLRTRCILELPPGALARTRTEVGDILELQPLG